MIAGILDRRIRIERKQVGADDGYGGGEITWVEVATVWAEVQDVLPSKSETQSDVIRTATRPARIRMRYRSGITSDMRVIIIERGMTMQVIAGPAEIGRREGIELMVEEYSTGGA
ncbi:phage head closure protein [Actimicrobium sp. CCC2.4]|uniref:phage head closure protein n=1 Tax=Actimicrobium sp. CCC2.4 TaxID=3048606 RepID=UPI002AC9CCE9|nr:phage head closure protein [Actimicrobium sp. CCC2.4]MEB0133784.1 phage head closure protein [Actimicrobium sp. CCC2.4]WPX31327.1 phage head closure protein [Actimicrobium sp. CCC2.4]